MGSVFRMPPLNATIALLLAVPALASCQFSVSAGQPDYEKLENAIADTLNATYEKISSQVSGVECPRQAEAPKKGDTFICKADLEGEDVRVQATLTDDDGNVDYRTMDTVYDLQALAVELSGNISADRGFEVTVSCGDGLKVVEIGKSFECVAADRRGDTRPVKVTAGGVDEEDRWELILEEGDE